MPAAYIFGILALGVIVLWRRTTAANEHAEEMMMLVAQDESGVRSLIAQGERIAAIKLARKITGLDLKASKELIDALRGGSGVTLPVRGTTDQADPLPARDPALLEMVARGDTIGAIKRWRELSGNSLIDAKRGVEQLRRK